MTESCAYPTTNIELKNDLMIVVLTGGVSSIPLINNQIACKLGMGCSISE